MNPKINSIFATQLMTTLLLLALGSSAFAGDAEAGKGKTALCAACHGADGNSAAGTFPKLAGQNERYLIKQIQDIKAGRRSVPQMIGMTDNLSDKDIEDIAAFYASNKAAQGAAKNDEDMLALGARIYRAGLPEANVAACAACHSPTGKGNTAAGFPALSGQHADYTKSQLEMFRSGARDNDGDSKIMRTIANRMHDTEIEAVANFIQGLH